jgi:hypothetical protein
MKILHIFAEGKNPFGWEQMVPNSVISFLPAATHCNHEKMLLHHFFPI